MMLFVIYDVGPNIDIVLGDI